MAVGFRGEVVEFYQRFRRGYPPAVVDGLVEMFGLRADDVVVDLGCGTGQLTRAVAGRVGAVVAVDPEADMIAKGRAVAGETGLSNVAWLLGADTDVPMVRAGVGDGRVGVVTVAQALHWMDHEALFAGVRPLLRPGGGVAVVTNGVPLWLQDNEWSRALRDVLTDWLGWRPADPCGTDDEAQRRYADALTAAGYATVVRTVDYSGELDLGQIVGGVLSAVSADRLPGPTQRARLTERIMTTLRPHLPCVELVRVTVLGGIRR